VKNAVLKGIFITFEGGEGAGKSTQIQRLKRKLQKRGATVVLTREPGGTPKAEQIRSQLLSGQIRSFGAFAEAVMFNAARINHLDELIRPALSRGEIVLCDRFSDSTRAYQGAAGHVDDVLIRHLEQVSVGESRPDLTFILDLPAEVGAARMERRAQQNGETKDRFETEPSDFHRHLRRAFLKIAEEEPQRCVIINARQTEKEVESAVWNVILERNLAPAPRGILG
jgi:dTMP kinase